MPFRGNDPTPPKPKSPLRHSFSNLSATGTDRLEPKPVTTEPNQPGRSGRVRRTRSRKSRCLGEARRLLDVPLVFARRRRLVAGSSTKTRKPSFARSAAAAAGAAALAGPKGRRRGSATKPFECGFSRPAGQLDPPRVRQAALAGLPPFTLGCRPSRCRPRSSPKRRSRRALLETSSECDRSPPKLSVSDVSPIETR